MPSIKETGSPPGSHWWHVMLTYTVEDHSDTASQCHLHSLVFQFMKPLLLTQGIWNQSYEVKPQLLGISNSFLNSHNLDYKLGLMSVVYKWKENFIKKVHLMYLHSYAVVITNQWACEKGNKLGSYELLILYLFKDVLTNTY